MTASVNDLIKDNQRNNAMTIGVLATGAHEPVLSSSHPYWRTLSATANTIGPTLHDVSMRLRGAARRQLC